MHISEEDVVLVPYYVYGTPMVRILNVYAPSLNVVMRNATPT